MSNNQVSSPEFSLGPDGAWISNVHGYAALKQLLAEFEREMQAHGWDWSSSLGPGLSKREIQRQTSEVGLQAPEELVALFEWHNGLSGIDGAPFVPLPDRLFPSLDRSLTRYRRDLESGSFRGAQGWVSIDFDSPGYMLSCNEGPDVAPLLRYVDEENPIEGERGLPSYRSICTLVGAWVVLLRAGAFSWTGSSWAYDDSRVPDDMRSVGIPPISFGGFHWE